MRELFGLTLRMILFLTVPATVGLIVLGRPIIELLFERDLFTAAVTEAVLIALTCYALGLPGHSLVEIVDRAFYALHDTATPVKAAVASMLVNLTLSAGVVILAVRGAVPGEHAYAGLALANSAAAWTEASLLVWWLRRRGGGGPDLVPLAVAVLRYLAAALAMGVLLVLLGDALAVVVDTTRLGGKLVVVGTLVGAGLFAYLAVSLGLGSREPRLLLSLLRR
jgi:putative peptidoglycan lipid II flippase